MGKRNTDRYPYGRTFGLEYGHGSAKKLIQQDPKHFPPLANAHRWMEEEKREIARIATLVERLDPSVTIPAEMFRWNEKACMEWLQANQRTDGKRDTLQERGGRKLLPAGFSQGNQRGRG